ncbi:Pup--protein ligase [Bifidobacterium pullorum subsp. saeculare]|uniref:Pup--protein ligase n=1 Tax=Bifidobacterium pullorum subsp. saeculare TaxID=78257 RepID=A0A938WVY8_9BIFI|nr:Pup--protein ligase [Bifidobacterium pullorum]MBM6698846.1 Pup--protein ligase [Bifidobacterium pullorum subsp. saeculare]
MPQLRDSGTRDLTHREPVPAAELDGFARIFGLETEYGVSVTGAGRPVDAGRVAMEMFRPVVSRSRSTNAYLPNGSRLYLDVGSHPEYATAEARDPSTALAQDLAGERIMARLAQGAQDRLRGELGERARIHVFKNNADSAGHSFGCHENYLVRRIVPLPLIEAQLLPFLVTRQLYTGAGRLADGGYQITQRADFLDEAVSSATTRARPMVNTRDEPHADPEAFRRLHVIIGDSNRSQWATWMKLATTHLVLCAIEDAVRRDVPCGAEGLALADPAAANRAVSRFLDDPAAPLALADGGAMSALAMQRRYLDLAGAFAASHPEAVPAGPDVLGEWSCALDALESGDWDVLADRVDWAAKRRLLAAYRRRHPEASDARLEALELDYHDIANGRAYAALLAHGGMRRLADGAIAAQAVQDPPSDTRAALRGAFVRQATQAGARFSCDWTTLRLLEPVAAEATLLDPFSTAADGAYARLMRAL